MDQREGTDVDMEFYEDVFVKFDPIHHSLHFILHILELIFAIQSSPTVSSHDGVVASVYDMVYWALVDSTFPTSCKRLIPKKTENILILLCMAAGTNFCKRNTCKFLRRASRRIPIFSTIHGGWTT